MASHASPSPQKVAAGRTKRPRDANRLLLLSILPFPVSIIATLLAVVVDADNDMRTVAPGSSLVGPGLACALIVLTAIVLFVRARWAEPGAPRFALLVGAVTSLMAWPVWVMGPLPSVNGIAHGEPRQTMMRLEGLTTTTISRSPDRHHWALLQPAQPGSPLARGRFLISPSLHDRLQKQPDAMLMVEHTTGLLGAEIVLDYRDR